MKKRQFSKFLILLILIVSLFDMQIPFVLAYLGREKIAETLAITIVTEIIGVFAVYSIKAYFETKEQEKNKLERDKMNDGLVPVDIEEKENKNEG